MRDELLREHELFAEMANGPDLYGWDKQTWDRFIGEYNRRVSHCRSFAQFQREPRQTFVKDYFVVTHHGRMNLEPEPLPIVYIPRMLEQPRQTLITNYFGATDGLVGPPQVTRRLYTQLTEEPLEMAASIFPPAQAVPPKVTTTLWSDDSDLSDVSVSSCTLSLSLTSQDVANYLHDIDEPCHLLDDHNLADSDLSTSDSESNNDEVVICLHQKCQNIVRLAITWRLMSEG